MHTGLDDDARFCDGCGDIGGPGKHPVGARHRRDLVRGIDAILQRQRDGPLPASHHGAEQRQRVRVAVAFHGEDSHVDRRDLAGRVRCADFDREVAERPANRQAAGTNRLEMPSAGEKRDLVAGARELGAVVPANGARAHHAEAHEDRNFTTIRQNRYLIQRRA